MTLALVAACCAGVVRAAEDKEPPVQVEVWAIRATMRNEKVADELKGIAKVLRKQFKYTGFTVARKTGKRVELGKELDAPLVDDYQATVKPLKRDDGKIQLELVVTKKLSDEEGRKSPKAKPKVVLKTTVRI